MKNSILKVVILAVTTSFLTACYVSFPGLRSAAYKSGLVRITLANFTLGSCQNIGPRFDPINSTLKLLSCYAQVKIAYNAQTLVDTLSFVLLDLTLRKASIDPAMPIVVQLPQEATELTGAFSGEINGDLIIKDHGRCINTAPNHQLCAASAYKLVSIELPDQALLTLENQYPTASFEFEFKLGEQKETILRAFVAAKGSLNGKDYYIPVVPSISDISQAPTISIRPSSNQADVTPEFDEPLPDADFVNIFTDSDLILDSRISGSWYDPSYDGQGWNLQVISPELAIAYWFSFDTSGNEQAWFYSLGNIVGNKILFTKSRITANGRFGPQFNPDDVTHEWWGGMTFAFDGCNTGFVVFSGDYPYQSGVMQIQRLTSLQGHQCSTRKALFIDKTTGPESGPYYDPSHDGEGWLLEILDDNTAVAYWFTYDNRGNQAWFVGLGEIIGNSIEFNEMYRPIGATFGQNRFKPSDVDRLAAGSMRFTFDNCSTGSMTYDLSQAGFGSGTLQLQKITNLYGDECQID